MHKHKLRPLHKHIHSLQQGKSLVYTIKSRENSKNGTSTKANSQPSVNLLNTILPLKEGKLTLTFFSLT